MRKLQAGQSASSYAIPPDGRGFGHVELDARFRVCPRINGVARRLKMKMAGGQPAQAMLRNPDQLEPPHPARGHGGRLIFFADRVRFQIHVLARVGKNRGE